MSRALLQLPRTATLEESPRDDQSELQMESSAVVTGDDLILAGTNVRKSIGALVTMYRNSK